MEPLLFFKRHLRKLFFSKRMDYTRILPVLAFSRNGFFVTSTHPGRENDSLRGFVISLPGYNPGKGEDDAE